MPCVSRYFVVVVVVVVVAVVVVSQDGLKVFCHAFSRMANPNFVASKSVSAEIEKSIRGHPVPPLDKAADREYRRALHETVRRKKRSLGKCT